MVSAVATLFLAIVGISYAAVSTKKGVCMAPAAYTCDDLTPLTGINIWHSWAVKLPKEDGQACSSTPSQEYMSMVPKSWNLATVGARIPAAVRYLQIFNEPNMETQANMSPQEAATNWMTVQNSIDAEGRDDVKLISPSASTCNNNCLENDPVVWFDQFFGNCTTCRIDYMATHFYWCNATATMTYINKLFDRFDLKIWLTEFSCPNADTTTEITNYMKDVIDLLEASDRVEKYFWYSSRMPEVAWLPKMNQLLEDGTTTLTEVGQVWNTHMPA